MSNIVNFAEKSGLTELKELRQALDTAYDSVNEQYSKVLQIEAKLRDLQALYDIHLHSLGKKIGYANIPDDYLDYATITEDPLDLGQIH